MNRSRAYAVLCVGWVCLAANGWAAFNGDLELDLSSTSDVKNVLLLPPLVQVAVKPSGLSFAGVEAKMVERFDNAGLAKLFPAFSKELSGRVVPVDAAQAVIKKEQIKASQAKQPGTLARAAKAADAAWVVVFEVSKNGTLTATIHDALGESQGTAVVLPQASALKPKDTSAVAAAVVKQLADLSAPKTAPVAEAAPVALESIPPTGSEAEDVAGDVDAELRRERQSRVLGVKVDHSQVRWVVATGAGASTRSLAVSGEVAARLAELRNQAAPGLGVYVNVAPLKFVEEWAEQPWSELQLFGHYRKGFVRATGASAGLEGQACGVIDDDFQIGGRVGYKLGKGYWPLVAVGGGWTQERAWIGCGLPVASTTARGIDVQLQVEQPLVVDRLALKVSGGPRFLMKGEDAAPQGLSVAGEAWLEAKPVSVLFARGGARLVRNRLVTPDGLALVDLRLFYAMEVGVFF